ncbi:MAG TPA: hypothetical protein VLA77_00330 [Candidatus Saccharimonadales bacterium]|nr:hypothetical protein [Candidatus Saccharimonadales bacterium]
MSENPDYSREQQADFYNAGEFLEDDQDSVLRDEMRRDLFLETIRSSRNRGASLIKGVGCEVHVTENGHPYVIVSDIIKRDYVERGGGHDALDIQRFDDLTEAESGKKTRMFSKKAMKLADGLGLDLGNLVSRGWIKMAEDGSVALELIGFSRSRLGNVQETNSWLQELRMARDYLGIDTMSFENGKGWESFDQDEVISFDHPEIRVYLDDESFTKIDAGDFASDERVVGTIADLNLTSEFAEHRGVTETDLWPSFLISDSKLHAPLYEHLNKEPSELFFPVPWGDKEIQVSVRFEGERSNGELKVELFVNSPAQDAEREYVHEATAVLQWSFLESLRQFGEKTGELPVKEIKVKKIVNGKTL